MSRLAALALLLLTSPAIASEAPTAPNAARAASFGAVGDGSTDDAAALRTGNGAVAIPGVGFGSLMLDSAPGYALGTGVRLYGGQQWKGGGATQGLKCNAATEPCTTLNGDFSALYNLPLTFTGPANSQSSVGVQIGTGEQGSSPVLRDVRVHGFGLGVDILSNVTGKLDNLTVDSFASPQIGIRHRNIANSDAGDWTYSGVTVSHPIGQGRLVSYESGGGMKVVSFKGLGGTIGWDMNLPDGTATQDFQFSASSIENSSVACMKFARQPGGMTGVFGNISIVGNEFAGCPYALWFAGPGPQNAVVTGNNFSAISGVPIRLDPGSNNVVVGKNSIDGAIMVQDNRTGFSDEYGFLDRSDTVALYAPDGTNWRTAYTINLPPYRGASIHIVLEGVIQGVGSFTRDEEFLLTSTGSGPLTVTGKSGTAAGLPIGFLIDTSAPNAARILYRMTTAGGPLQGTATIVPLGKMVSVSR
jgi:hypothetical protein